MAGVSSPVKEAWEEVVVWAGGSNVLEVVKEIMVVWQKKALMMLSILASLRGLLALEGYCQSGDPKQG
jgi:hypothetical protein